MPRSAEELTLDIEELKKLHESAIRTHVKETLMLEVRRLETALNLLQNTQTVKDTSTPTPRPVRCYDVKLTDYAWDQSEKFVKFFVTLKNVHTLQSEKVTCNFANRSFELQVKELDNRNYSLTIKNLLEMIDPAKSHWKVKTDMVVVFVAKEQQGSTWSSVTADEKKLKDAAAPKVDPNAANSDDPNAGLMSMLKQMYESGDDETKRAIAKSFAESRNRTPEFPSI